MLPSRSLPASYVTRAEAAVRQGKQATFHSPMTLSSTRQFQLSVSVKTRKAIKRKTMLLQKA